MSIIDYYNSQSLAEQIVLIVLVISFCVQLIQYWFVFGRMAFYKNQQKEVDFFPPVSIVIAARDEYYNLKDNLRSILEQDYPEFEVVIINNSDDDNLSHYFLKDISKQYSHLKHVDIKPDINFFVGKKFPLSIGIKEAKFEHLLFIDADCKPVSNQWIRKMMSNYNQPNIDIVLGYGGFFKQKGFFNKFCHFDSLWVGMQYLSASILGVPYMGVGRNLSYKKSLFIKEQGFTSHYTTASGDDDIFINKVATQQNCTICLDKEGITLSKAKRNFKEWVRQKMRHFSASSKYKMKNMIMLTFFPLFQMLFFITVVWSFIIFLKTSYWYLVPTLFVIRLFSQLFITKKCMKKLGEDGFLGLVPLFEILFMFIVPIILTLSTVFKTKRWK